MKIVKLEDIEIGMIAAKDVQDGKGSILIKAGTKLDKNTQGLLARRQVHKLWVETPEDSLKNDNHEDETKKIAREMAAVFKDRLDDKIMEQIMKRAFRYRTSQVAQPTDDKKNAKKK